MEKQKALVINCALCDARKVAEETLAPYDKVTIHCAKVLTNPDSRRILSQKAVNMNCSDVQDVVGETAVVQVNGISQIKPDSAPAGNTVLIVNGRLDIEPGCEDVLRNYHSIQINGNIVCPESLAGLVSQKATINGSLETYPDGAIRLKRNIVLDWTFALRAKENSRYYARRMVALDAQIDFARLAELGVRFFVRQLLIAEGLVREAAPLFDEQAEIIVLPDACVYLTGDWTLDQNLVNQRGGKLYIQGDLTIHQDSASCLDQIEYLRVTGDLRVTPGMMERVRRLPVECENWQPTGGLLLKNQEDIQLTRSLLEGAPEGVSLLNCGEVAVASDAPLALLREKLVSLVNCSDVVCTTEQAEIIQTVCKNCGSIGPKEEQSGQDRQEAENWETTQINCAFYTM